jgi:hypothetical protein
MPTHRFPVDVDIPTTESAAVRALGVKSLEDSLPILADIAMREWLEWLVADDRPASLHRARPSERDSRKWAAVPRHIRCRPRRLTLDPAANRR